MAAARNRAATALLALALVVAAPRAAGEVVVEPNPVRIDATFRGGILRVRGEALPGADVLVAITGESSPEKFQRKGRVGPVWANVGSHVVSGAPSLLLVAGSRPAGTLLDRTSLDARGLDLASVTTRIAIDPPGTEPGLLQREFLSLKRSRGKYGEHDGAVRLEPGDPPRYEAVIPWPDSAAPGEYRVSVVQCAGGVVLAEESTILRVELVGFPRFIEHMAFQRGSLYGALSVGVALAVGFLMGLVFKKGGGH